MLPTQAIEEFKNLFRKRFNADISDEEASLRANNLVDLCELVYGSPFPLSNLDLETVQRSENRIMQDEINRTTFQED